MLRWAVFFCSLALYLVEWGVEMLQGRLDVVNLRANASTCRWEHTAGMAANSRLKELVFQ